MTWLKAAEPSLFEGLVSRNVAPLDTTLVNTAPATLGAVMVTVKFVFAFAASDGTVHCMTPLLLDPPPDALTNVAPVGITFVTKTFVVANGPRFVIAIV